MFDLAQFDLETRVNSLIYQRISFAHPHREFYPFYPVRSIVQTFLPDQVWNKIRIIKLNFDMFSAKTKRCIYWTFTQQYLNSHTTVSLHYHDKLSSIICKPSSTISLLIQSTPVNVIAYQE